MKSIAPPTFQQASEVINRSKQYLRSGSKKPLDGALAPLNSEKLKNSKAAADAALNSSSLPSVDIPKPPSLDIPDAKVDISDGAKEAAKQAKDIADKKKVADEAKKVAELKEKKLKHSVDKPGIFFLGGSDLFSVGSVTGSYSGIKDMAEYVEGARYYGWDQKTDILSEIDKRKPEQPIVLVGHSLGGDTIVEIANKLNTLEHGYRKVDLLFTLDSVGMDNDLIPSNVKKNIHYFSNENFLINDGPNWAKNQDKTTVENNLVEVDHTDLDDNHDIQAHILAEIESILS